MPDHQGVSTDEYGGSDPPPDTAWLERTVRMHDIPLDHPPRETLGRRPPPSLDPPPPTAPAAPAAPPLPRVRVGSAADADPKADYLVREQLGAGGMGVVELATQVSLHRDVALKRLHSPQPRSRALALVHEARITGHLEHPNIVPVHTVGIDPSRGPVVIMKRIQGTPWDELIAASQTPLVRHLEILLQLCNALSFAHSRGIVHCDVKPANVMVGEFGEVHLVDWGIALETGKPDEPDEPDERGKRGKRGKRGNDGPRGSPVHMAPELAMGCRADIDERTDVYLLGACLHEVLTGSARHDGADLLAVMCAAAVSEPAEYAEDVPAELGVICNRACHRHRDERYPNAAAFGLALRSYLDDRSALELTTAALTRLGALQQSIDGSLESPGDDDDARLQGLFRESLFAFEYVLKTS